MILDKFTGGWDTYASVLSLYDNKLNFISKYHILQNKNRLQNCVQLYSYNLLIYWVIDLFISTS